jgi:hypothetical protein
MGRRGRTQRQRIDKQFSHGAAVGFASANRSAQPRTVALGDAINAVTVPGRRLVVDDETLHMVPMMRDPRDRTGFGPSNPLDPAAIDPSRKDTGRPEPRLTEYPVSWNLPGSAAQPIPWATLRAAAENVDIMRRCIAVRQEQLQGLDWSITLDDQLVQDQYAASAGGTGREDIEAEMRRKMLPEIERLTAFWKNPWKANGVSFEQWCNGLMEDHLVLDAVSIYPRFTYGGDLSAFELIDPTTIRLLIDYRGARPEPPFPAFQQDLYGFPRAEFGSCYAEGDTDGSTPAEGIAAGSLFYFREQYRSFTPYGFSAVQQALISARLYLRRQGWMLAEYDDGSTPLTFLVPDPKDGTMVEALTPRTRQQWEDSINAMYAGNTRQRHRMKVLQPGMTPYPMQSVDERYKPDYDMHLIKMLAGHFGVTSTGLGFSESKGLGNSGLHEGQADVQQAATTKPDRRMIERIVNELMCTYQGAPAELKFKFTDPDVEDQAAEDASANAQRARGTITLNDDRKRIGKSPYTFPEADMPMAMLGTGWVPIEGMAARAEQAAEAEQALVEDQLATSEQGRELAAGEAEAEELSGETAEKALELAAYRRWARKRGGDARRPFICKALEPGDWPGQDVPRDVDFVDWAWQVDDAEIEKSFGGNDNWRTLSRDHRGRWVKRGSMRVDALGPSTPDKPVLAGLRADAERRRAAAAAPKPAARQLPVSDASSTMDGMTTPRKDGYTSEGDRMAAQHAIDNADIDVPASRARFGRKAPATKTPEQADASVRDVVNSLADEPGAAVSMVDVRRKLAAEHDMDRDQQDAALRRLITTGDRSLNAAPEDNQKTLTDEDHRDALDLGAGPQHNIWLDPPRAATPAARTEAIAAQTPDAPSAPTGPTARSVTGIDAAPVERQAALRETARKLDERHAEFFPANRAELERDLASEREYLARTDLNADERQVHEKILAELEQLERTPRGDAAVQATKAARELIDLADAQGMIVMVSHSSSNGAGGGSPYFTVQAISPDMKTGFKATFHTFKGKNGSYGRMNSEVMKDGRSKDASLTAIRDAITNANKPAPTVETAAPRNVDPSVKVSAAEVREGDWRWHPSEGWQKIGLIVEERSAGGMGRITGGRTLYGADRETRLGQLHSSTEQIVARQDAMPTMPPRSEGLKGLQRKAGEAAKRGDVYVVERTDNSYIGGGRANADRKSYEVYEVTSVTREGKPRKVRRMTDADGHEQTMDQFGSLGRTLGYGTSSVVPGDKIDKEGLAADLRARTYTNSTTPKSHDDLRELGDVLYGRMKPAESTPTAPAAVAAPSVNDMMAQQMAERAAYEAERERRAAAPLDIRPTTRSAAKPAPAKRAEQVAASTPDAPMSAAEKRELSQRLRALDAEVRQHEASNTVGLSKRQRDMAARFDQLAGEHGSDKHVAMWRQRAIDLTGEMESADRRDADAIRSQMAGVQDEFTHAMAGAQAAAAARGAGGDDRAQAIANSRATLDSRARKVEQELSRLERQIKDYSGESRKILRKRINDAKAKAKGFRDRIESVERDHDTKLIYDESGRLVDIKHQPPTAPTAPSVNDMMAQQMAASVANPSEFGGQYGKVDASGIDVGTRVQFRGTAWKVEEKPRKAAVNAAGKGGVLFRATREDQGITSTMRLDEGKTIALAAPKTGDEGPRDKADRLAREREARDPLSEAARLDAVAARWDQVLRTPGDGTRDAGARANAEHARSEAARIRASRPKAEAAGAAPVTGAAALAAAPKDVEASGARGIDRAGRTAIEHYRGKAFTEINYELRSGGTGYAGVVGRIDGVMAESKLTSDVTVHRAVGNVESIFGDAAGKKLTGAEWTDAAYQSTSADADIADRFLATGGSTRTSARIVMRVPAGTGAVQLSDERYEAELLLQRGLRMRVVSDTGPWRRGQKNPRTIEVEVVLA